MKLLVISDIHLDAVTAGRPRLAEVNEYLEDAHHAIVREQADLVIFAGDAFDPGGLLQNVYTAHLVRWLLAYVRAGATLVAIAGNHDVLDTSELFWGAPATTLTPLRVAASFVKESDRVFVCEMPAFVAVSIGWGVLALPYVSRAHSSLIRSWTDNALRSAATFRASGGRVIVAGHLVIPGATMGSESAEMARGQDMMFPFAEVKALEPALVINGHYHARQEVLGDCDLPIQIPGSPLRFTFGEVAEDTKGFLIASFP